MSEYGCGTGLAANILIHGPNCSFDYAALGSHQLPFTGKIGTQNFSSLEEALWIEENGLSSN